MRLRCWFQASILVALAAGTGSGSGARAGTVADPVAAIVFVDSHPEKDNRQFARFLEAMRQARPASGRKVEFLSIPGRDREGARREALAAFARSQPRVAVTIDTDIALDLRAQRLEVPLVLATMADPVDLGLVESRGARQANVTGVMMARDSMVKQLELLRECAPGMRRVGVLGDRYWIGSARGRRALAMIEQQTGQPPVIRVADDAAELARVLAGLSRTQADGWVVPSVPAALAQAQLVVRRFEALGVPVVYAHAAFAQAGAPLAFHTPTHHIYDRLAFLASQAASGIAPREIPFEAPFRYVVAINASGSERSAWKLPKSIVKRAEVIH